MSIIPGTTPTLTLSLDRSITGCAAAEFCLACGTVRLCVRSQSFLCPQTVRRSAYA